MRATVPGGPRREFTLRPLPLAGAELLAGLDGGGLDGGGLDGGGLPGERATAMLARCVDGGAEVVAGLAEGDRQALLIQLYQLTFGPAARGLTRCGCGAELELSIVLDDLLLPAYGDVRPAYDLVSGGYAVSYRLPTAGDLGLAAAMEHRVPGGGVAALLRACVLAASRTDDGVVVGADDLPEGVAAAVGSAMAARDPQADIELSVSCVECGGVVPVAFDIAAFLMAELSALASGLLAEVHVLASHYHWSEAEILALPAARRTAYLGMIA